MTKIKKPTVKKKAYTKPSVKEVRLVANEAVLNVCKNGSSSVMCLGSCVSSVKDPGS